MPPLLFVHNPVAYTLILPKPGPGAVQFTWNVPDDLGLLCYGQVEGNDRITSCCIVECNGSGIITCGVGLPINPVVTITGGLYVCRSSRRINS